MPDVVAPAITINVPPSLVARIVPPPTVRSVVIDRGERPWWMSDDPEVWRRNQDRMHVGGKSDNHNLIAWKAVGTNASARAY